MTMTEMDSLPTSAEDRAMLVKALAAYGRELAERRDKAVDLLRDEPEAARAAAAALDKRMDDASDLAMRIINLSN